jgi:hypothetical protein
MYQHPADGVSPGGPAGGNANGNVNGKRVRNSDGNSRIGCEAV